MSAKTVPGAVIVSPSEEEDIRKLYTLACLECTEIVRSCNIRRFSYAGSSAVVSEIQVRPQ